MERLFMWPYFQDITPEITKLILSYLQPFTSVIYLNHSE